MEKIIDNNLNLTTMNNKIYESPQLIAVEIEIEHAIMQASSTNISDYPGIFGEETDI